MSMRDNPFDSLEDLFDRMSRQFEEAARGLEGEWDWSTEMGTGRMNIDLADRGDAFVLTADVPGYEKEEIDVRLADNRLTIVAEHEESAEEETETYIRSERQHRAMRDSVRLPAAVDADAVTAACKNGVLTVTLPKVEPTEEARRIDIE